MTISGFTMARNASKLYYPIKQAIESILPIVDEFVVAIGEGDADDITLQEVQSIGSEKVKIIHTKWDLEKFPKGMVHAQQTDVAMKACKGDWLFYLQSDEVVHEKFLPVIKKRCEELLHDQEVEGLLFKYRHFWGDYDHYFKSHVWYPNEIRIVRNKPDIHSFWSAQSFRRIPNFDGLSYRKKEGTFKLKVAKVDAYIYHYGWVRPPKFMQNKRKAFGIIHRGKEFTEKEFEGSENLFDFGDLSKLSIHTEGHPAVMAEWISKMDWRDQLYPNYVPANPMKHKHDKLKYRILSFFEQTFFGGRLIGGYKNYKLLRK